MGNGCSKCCKCNEHKQANGTLSSTGSVYHRRSRGELPIENSDRFRITQTSNAVQLAVEHVQREDAGHYTLYARTKAGSVIRKDVELLVEDRSTGDDPPIFLRRLGDLSVKVGTRTRLLVEIRSSTDVKITWYRNDRRICENDRIKQINEGSFYCVEITPVILEDGGQWMVMAENLGGRNSCIAHLNVLVPKAYKSPEFIEELRAVLTDQGTVSLECKVVGVPTPVLRWFKDSKEIKAGDVFALTANPDDPTSLGTYTCEAVNCMGKTYSSSKVHVVGRGSREGSLKPADSVQNNAPPPIFTNELRGTSVRIGDTIILGCQVVVPPWPKAVAWYNKEGRVEANDKYKLIEDGLGVYMIEIKPSESCDEGEWKCVVTSQEGCVGISSCSVTMDIPKNYRKPRFMESLKAVLTEEGLVSFECKVVGFPTPTLKWFKDGQELKPGDVYQLTGTNSLGTYCCIAKNCMGENSSVAVLTIEDIENQLNDEERIMFTKQNQPPKFVSGLKTQDAKINEPFRFTVTVKALPDPVLSWFRDELPIESNERYNHYAGEEETYHLDVKCVEFVDQAEWKCVAVNDFGTSVTSCFLKLQIPRHYKKPRFLECLRAVLTEEGAVNLECKVIGVPQPVLKWYKDGIELKPGDIHRIISGQDGTCCLGTYTCEARNCMGVVASSASLLGFEDAYKNQKAEPTVNELQRNFSLSTIQEERTSQMYESAIGDITIDEKGDISFSFDGKEVSVSLYETPDLTEEEALKIVEMYADQISEHVTEQNIVELPPLRFIKETSQSGNLLMEAVVIDIAPEYFLHEEDMRTEAGMDDISICEVTIHGSSGGQEEPTLDKETEDFAKKNIEKMEEELAMTAPMRKRKKSRGTEVEEYFSLSYSKASESQGDEDTSELQTYASASQQMTSSKIESLEMEQTHVEEDVQPPKRKKDKKSPETDTSMTTDAEAILQDVSGAAGDGLQLLKPSKAVTDEKEIERNLKSLLSLAKLLKTIETHLVAVENEVTSQSAMMMSPTSAEQSIGIIRNVLEPIKQIQGKMKVYSGEIPIEVLFQSMEADIRALHIGLQVIEKCVAMDETGMTLIQRTSVCIIDSVGEQFVKTFEEVKNIANKFESEHIKMQTDLTADDIQQGIQITQDTIKALALLQEAQEIETAQHVSDSVAKLQTMPQTVPFDAITEAKLPSEADSLKLICRPVIKIQQALENIENELSMEENEEQLYSRVHKTAISFLQGPVDELQLEVDKIEQKVVAAAGNETIEQKINMTILDIVSPPLFELKKGLEIISKQSEGNIHSGMMTVGAIESMVPPLQEIQNGLAQLGQDIEFGQVKEDFVPDSADTQKLLQSIAQGVLHFETNIERLSPRLSPNLQEGLVGLKDEMSRLIGNILDCSLNKYRLTVLENLKTPIDELNYCLRQTEQKSISGSLSDLIDPIRGLREKVQLGVDILSISDVQQNDLNIRSLVQIKEIIRAIEVDIEEHEFKLLQKEIELDEKQATEVDQSFVSMREALSLQIAKEEAQKTVEKIEEIYECLATLQDDIALEEAKTLTSDHISILKQMTKPIKDVLECVARIKSGIAFDTVKEFNSDVNFKVLQEIAEPVHDLAEALKVITAPKVVDIKESLSIQEDISALKTLAQPVLELRNCIAKLGQEVAFEEQVQSLDEQQAILKIARPLNELQDCLDGLIRKTMAETMEDVSTLEDISGLKTTGETASQQALLSQEDQPMEEIEELELDSFKQRKAETLLIDLKQSLTSVLVHCSQYDVSSLKVETLNKLHATVTKLKDLDKCVAEACKTSICDPLVSVSERTDPRTLAEAVMSLESCVLQVEDCIPEENLRTLSASSLPISNLKVSALSAPLQELRECLQVFHTQDFENVETFTAPKVSLTSKDLIEEVTDFVVAVQENQALETLESLIELEQLKSCKEIIAPIQQLQKAVLQVHDQYHISQVDEVSSQVPQSTFAKPLMSLQEAIINIQEQYPYSTFEACPEFKILQAKSNAIYQLLKYVEHVNCEALDNLAEMSTQADVSALETYAASIEGSEIMQAVQTEQRVMEPVDMKACVEDGIKQIDSCLDRPTFKTSKDLKAVETIMKELKTSFQQMQRELSKESEEESSILAKSNIARTLFKLKECLVHTYEGGYEESLDDIEKTFEDILQALPELEVLLAEEMSAKVLSKIRETVGISERCADNHDAHIEFMRRLAVPLKELADDIEKLGKSTETEVSKSSAQMVGLQSRLMNAFRALNEISESVPNELLDHVLTGQSVLVSVFDFIEATDSLRVIEVIQEIDNLIAPLNGINEILSETLRQADGEQLYELLKPVKEAQELLTTVQDQLASGNELATKLATANEVVIQNLQEKIERIENEILVKEDLSQLTVEEVRDIQSITEPLEKLQQSLMEFATQQMELNSEMTHKRKADMEESANDLEIRHKEKGEHEVPEKKSRLSESSPEKAEAPQVKQYATENGSGGSEADMSKAPEVCRSEAIEVQQLQTQDGSSEVKKVEDKAPQVQKDLTTEVSGEVKEKESKQVSVTKDLKKEEEKVILPDLSLIKSQIGTEMFENFELLRALKEQIIKSKDVKLQKASQEVLSTLEITVSDLEKVLLSSTAETIEDNLFLPLFKMRDLLAFMKQNQDLNLENKEILVSANKIFTSILNHNAGLRRTFLQDIVQTPKDGLSNIIPLLEEAQGLETCRNLLIVVQNLDSTLTNVVTKNEGCLGRSSEAFAELQGNLNDLQNQAEDLGMRLPAVFKQKCVEPLVKICETVKDSETEDVIEVLQEMEALKEPLKVLKETIARNIKNFKESQTLEETLKAEVEAKEKDSTGQLEELEKKLQKLGDNLKAEAEVEEKETEKEVETVNKRLDSKEKKAEGLEVIESTTEVARSLESQKTEDSITSSKKTKSETATEMKADDTNNIIEAPKIKSKDTSVEKDNKGDAELAEKKDAEITSAEPQVEKLEPKKKKTKAKKESAEIKELGESKQAEVLEIEKQSLQEAQLLDAEKIEQQRVEDSKKEIKITETETKSKKADVISKEDIDQLERLSETSKKAQSTEIKKPEAHEAKLFDCEKIEQQQVDNSQKDIIIVDLESITQGADEAKILVKEEAQLQEIGETPKKAEKVEIKTEEVQEAHVLEAEKIEQHELKDSIKEIESEEMEASKLTAEKSFTKSECVEMGQVSSSPQKLSQQGVDGVQPLKADISELQSDENDRLTEIQPNLKTESDASKKSEESKHDAENLEATKQKPTESEKEKDAALEPKAPELQKPTESIEAIAKMEAFSLVKKLETFTCLPQDSKMKETVVSAIAELEDLKENLANGAPDDENLLKSVRKAFFKLRECIVHTYDGSKLSDDDEEANFKIIDEAFKDILESNPYVRNQICNELISNTINSIQEVQTSLCERSTQKLPKQLQTLIQPLGNLKESIELVMKSDDNSFEKSSNPMITLQTCLMNIFFKCDDIASIQDNKEVKEALVHVQDILIKIHDHFDTSEQFIPKIKISEDVSRLSMPLETILKLLAFEEAEEVALMLESKFPDTETETEELKAVEEVNQSEFESKLEEKSVIETEVVEIPGVKTVTEEEKIDEASLASPTFSSIDEVSKKEEESQKLTDLPEEEKKADIGSLLNEQSKQKVEKISATEKVEGDNQVSEDKETKKEDEAYSKEISIEQDKSSMLLEHIEVKDLSENEKKVSNDQVMLPDTHTAETSQTTVEIIEKKKLEDTQKDLQVEDVTANKLSGEVSITEAELIEKRKLEDNVRKSSVVDVMIDEPHTAIIAEVKTVECGAVPESRKSLDIVDINSQGKIAVKSVTEPELVVETSVDLSSQKPEEAELEPPAQQKAKKSVTGAESVVEEKLNETTQKGEVVDIVLAVKTAEVCEIKPAAIETQTVDENKIEIQCSDIPSDKAQSGVKSITEPLTVQTQEVKTDSVKPEIKEIKASEALTPEISEIKPENIEEGVMIENKMATNVEDVPSTPLNAQKHTTESEKVEIKTMMDSAKKIHQEEVKVETQVAETAEIKSEKIEAITVEDKMSISSVEVAPEKLIAECFTKKEVSETESETAKKIQEEEIESAKAQVAEISEIMLETVENKTVEDTKMPVTSTEIEHDKLIAEKSTTKADTVKVEDLSEDKQNVNIENVPKPEIQIASIEEIKPQVIEKKELEQSFEKPIMSEVSAEAQAAQKSKTEAEKLEVKTLTENTKKQEVVDLEQIGAKKADVSEVEYKQEASSQKTDVELSTKEQEAREMEMEDIERKSKKLEDTEEAKKEEALIADEEKTVKQTLKDLENVEIDVQETKDDEIKKPLRRKSKASPEKKITEEPKSEISKDEKAEEAKDNEMKKPLRRKSKASLEKKKSEELKPEIPTDDVKKIEETEKENETVKQPDQSKEENIEKKSDKPEKPKRKKSKESPEKTKEVPEIKTDVDKQKEESTVSSEADKTEEKKDEEIKTAKRRKSKGSPEKKKEEDTVVKSAGDDVKKNEEVAESEQKKEEDEKKAESQKSKTSPAEDKDKKPDPSVPQEESTVSSEADKKEEKKDEEIKTVKRRKSKGSPEKKKEEETVVKSAGDDVKKNEKVAESEQKKEEDEKKAESQKSKTSPEEDKDKKPDPSVPQEESTVPSEADKKGEKKDDDIKTVKRRKSKGSAEKKKEEETVVESAGDDVKKDEKLAESEQKKEEVEKKVASQTPKTSSVEDKDKTPDPSVPQQESTVPPEADKKEEKTDDEIKTVKRRKSKGSPEKKKAVEAVVEPVKDCVKKDTKEAESEQKKEEDEKKAASQNSKTSSEEDKDKKSDQSVPQQEITVPPEADKEEMKKDDEIKTVKRRKSKGSPDKKKEEEAVVEPVKDGFKKDTKEAESEQKKEEEEKKAANQKSKTISEEDKQTKLDPSVSQGVTKTEAIKDNVETTLPQAALKMEEARPLEVKTFKFNILKSIVETVQSRSNDVEATKEIKTIVVDLTRQNEQIQSRPNEDNLLKSMSESYIKLRELIVSTNDTSSQPSKEKLTDIKLSLIESLEPNTCLRRHISDGLMKSSFQVMEKLKNNLIENSSKKITKDLVPLIEPLSNLQTAVESLTKGEDEAYDKSSGRMVSLQSCLMDMYFVCDDIKPKLDEKLSKTVQSVMKLMLEIHDKVENATGSIERIVMGECVEDTSSAFQQIYAIIRRSQEEENVIEEIPAKIEETVLTNEKEILLEEVKKESSGMKEKEEVLEKDQSTQEIRENLKTEVVESQQTKPQKSNVPEIEADKIEEIGSTKKKTPSPKTSPKKKKSEKAESAAVQSKPVEEDTVIQENTKQKSVEEKLALNEKEVLDKSTEIKKGIDKVQEDISKPTIAKDKDNKTKEASDSQEQVVIEIQSTDSKGTTEESQKQTVESQITQESKKEEKKSSVEDKPVGAETQKKSDVNKAESVTEAIDEKATKKQKSIDKTEVPKDKLDHAEPESDLKAKKEIKKPETADLTKPEATETKPVIEDVEQIKEKKPDTLEMKAEGIEKKDIEDTKKKAKTTKLSPKKKVAEKLVIEPEPNDAKSTESAGVKVVEAKETEGLKREEVNKSEDQTKINETTIKPETQDAKKTDEKKIEISEQKPEEAKQSVSKKTSPKKKVAKKQTEETNEQATDVAKSEEMPTHVEQNLQGKPDEIEESRKLEESTIKSDNQAAESEKKAIEILESKSEETKNKAAEEPEKKAIEILESKTKETKSKEEEETKSSLSKKPSPKKKVAKKLDEETSKSTSQELEKLNIEEELLEKTAIIELDSKKSQNERSKTSKPEDDEPVIVDKIESEKIAEVSKKKTKTSEKYEEPPKVLEQSKATSILQTNISEVEETEVSKRRESKPKDEEAKATDKKSKTVEEELKTELTKVERIQNKEASETISKRTTEQNGRTENTEESTEPRRTRPTKASEESVSEKIIEHSSHEIKERKKESKRAPNFDLKLTNRNSPLGSDIKLTCCISGSDVSVQWFKDKTPINQDTKHLLSYIDGLSSLEVRSVEKSDSGIYRCIASNRNGDIETSCLVSVYEVPTTQSGTPPIFTRNIRDTYQSQNHQITLECKVSGNPKPNIFWQKDNVLLEFPSEKYQVIELLEGIKQLVIANPNGDDSGLYTCYAESIGGQMKLSKFLDVTDHIKISKEEKKQSSTAVENVIVQDGKERAVKTREAKRKLNVEASLKDMIIGSGNKAQLLLSVSGPIDEVQWYKNGERIFKDSRHKIYNINGTLSLEIYDATTEDSGEYSCIAKNGQHQAENKCSLSIYDSRSGYKPPQSFDSAIRESFDAHRNEIILECNVHGRPRITWLKDDHIISNNRYRQFEEAGGLRRLVIRNPISSDFGSFSCYAETEDRIEAIAVTLKAADLKKMQASNTNGHINNNSTDDSYKHNRSLIYDLEEEVTRSRSAIKASSCGADVRRKPVFSMLLNDRTVLEGSNLRLTCNIVGGCEISWLKNHDQLPSSSRYQKLFSNGQATLEIYSAEAEDSGNYACRAFNEYGETLSYAQVKVFQSYDETPQPPMFIRYMKDTYSLNEDELVLDCRVRGNPRPEVQWMKESDMLYADDKYSVISQADGYCKLVINHPTEKDAGLYSCIARNSVKEEKITHQVDFRGKDRALLEKTHGFFHRDPNKPHLQNPLGNQTVTPGGTIAIMAEFLPTSSPIDVQWFRNRQPLSGLPNVKTFLDHGVYTLAISNAASEWEGSYMCRATNAYGRLETHANVDLAEKGGKAAGPPLFLSRPETEMKIAVGDPFSISFRLQGEPKPKLTLLKGTKDITKSDRVSKEASDDYIRFTVQKSQVSDSGTYFVVARNEFGTDRVFVTITVASDKKK